MKDCFVPGVSPSRFPSASRSKGVFSVDRPFAPAALELIVAVGARKCKADDWISTVENLSPYSVANLLEPAKEQRRLVREMI